MFAESRTVEDLFRGGEWEFLLSGTVDTIDIPKMKNPGEGENS